MKYTAAPKLPPSFRLKEISSGRSEVFKLDPRHIRREPDYNPREDFGDIPELAENILANGLLQPLRIRSEGGRIYLVDGDRRLTAVESHIAAGTWPVIPGTRNPEPIPCTSEPQNTKPLDRLFTTLSLNTGKPLTMMEKGGAYLRILEMDPAINASEIARRSGETKQAVSNALCLVRQGATELLAMVRSGALTATTALEIIKAHPESHSHQLTTALQATAAATAAGASHATPKHIPKPPPPTPNTGDSSVIIPDPDDDTDPSDISDTSDPSDPYDNNQSPEDSAPSPDAPADPSAYKNLLNAPSTHRDGSSGSGPAPGFASPDDRIKKLEKLLDDLDPDTVPTSRWNTVELILDYFKGNHDIRRIRDYLTSESGEED